MPASRGVPPRRKFQRARAGNEDSGWLCTSCPSPALIVALFTLNWEAEAAAILASLVILVLFGNWPVFALALLLVGLYFALNWNGSTAVVVGVALKPFRWRYG